VPRPSLLGRVSQRPNSYPLFHRSFLTPSVQLKKGQNRLSVVPTFIWTGPEVRQSLLSQRWEKGSTAMTISRPNASARSATACIRTLNYNGFRYLRVTLLDCYCCSNAHILTNTFKNTSPQDHWGEGSPPTPELGSGLRGHSGAIHSCLNMHHRER
jgi:hypothetical protein